MSNLKPAEMVAAYIKLRDYIKAAEEEMSQALARPREAMEKLEAQMLQYLQDTGANSMACDDGTVYRNTQFSATVENREAFKNFVESNDLWEAMDIRANKTFIREFMETKGTVVPGIKTSQRHTVGVRRS